MSDENYPQLLEFPSHESHVLGGRSRVTCGGAAAADIALEHLLPDQIVLEVKLDTDSWSLNRLDSGASINVNGSPLVEPAQLKHLDVIQVGKQVLVFVEHSDAAVSTSFSANMWLIRQMAPGDETPSQRSSVNLGATIEMPLDTLHGMDELAAPVEIELPGGIHLPEKQMLIGRDSKRADICLPDVRVSRMHAWIVRDGNTATITDLKSANGTFVDGHPVERPTVIRDGDRIQIGPYNLVFRGTKLYPVSHDKNVELVARNLSRTVPDRDHPGQLKRILDDVSLVARPREFVCILGPSGSGKTTLLSALSAHAPADQGNVLLNDESLYAHFDALKQNLAVVPQKEVLHDVLPLASALRYTAKMRLPKDMTRRDIDQRISEMLDSVNLNDFQRTQIRRLSGGQIKRASWVNEAICNPSLIFLDEVTSGLDEQTDAEMMQLFRQMADDGKTIVCVTHSLSYVEQNCHLVAIIAAGGVLAFYGPPAEALVYFGISRLGDVYSKLGEKSPDHWKKQFRKSEYHKDYIESRLQDDEQADEPVTARPRKQPRELLVFWRQFALLFRRYFAIRWADKKALGMMLGQSLFIAFLLIWLFGNLSNLDVQTEAEEMADVVAPGIRFDELLPETQEELLTEAGELKLADRSSKLLFLLCISCIWFGCNNAAKEIVKERTIYRKERDAGIRIISYYGSKLVLLGILSVLQAALLFWIVRGLTHLGGDANVQWLLLSVTALTGVALGLAISAVANSEDFALTTVPVILIPQIIFSGLIAPLINHTREFSQGLVSAYWSYQGLLMSLDDDLQKRLRASGNLDLDTTWAVKWNGSMLLAHTVLLAVAALVILYLRDSKIRKLPRLGTVK